MSGRWSRKLWGVLGALGLVLTTGAITIRSDNAVQVVEAAAPFDPLDVVGNTAKYPHYFGPYPNWANSPQTLTNAVVEFTGGGGTGAEATATVNPVDGSITELVVTDPGKNYTGPPTVAITYPGPTPTGFVQATATAQTAVGVVSSIAVPTPGTFTEPEVTITPVSGGIGASAVASGTVNALNILDGGSGYSINPTVVIGQPNLTSVNGAPSVQATATATMVGGVVDTIQIVNGGSGYTSAPNITINDGLLPPVTQPPAEPAVAASVSSTILVNQVDVTSGGSLYSVAPTVTILDLYPNPLTPESRGAVATATVSASVTGLTITNAGARYLTPGIQKFVDSLPGLGDTVATTNNLGDYIPVAVPDKVKYPGTDYYEIGLVQYRHQFSSDVPATLQRGYVQLWSQELADNADPATPVGSGFALTNAFLDSSRTDGVQTSLPNGDPVYGSEVLINGVPALGVDIPRYLGPTILAEKDVPVRVLFRNLLPAGQPGDLFLPVDTTLMGSGAGPKMMTLDANNIPNDMAIDTQSVTDAVRNPMCGENIKPQVTGLGTCFAQNRATLHMHGGVTPWISDGTPHQWITPAGESTWYPEGVSVSNVPDMPDPGAGAQTFFYTNQQSARLMWTHDHAWGITRLNVYAGEAAGFLLTDQTERNLFAADKDLATPGNQPGLFPDLGLGAPWIVQDKTFVSASVAAGETFVGSVAQNTTTDPTWNAAKWGGEGSLWTPHVYMPAQNPGSPTGMSEFGRWMYGPWFWPPAKDVKYPPMPNPYFVAGCDPNVILADGSNQFCEPALIPSTPNISVGMEAFNDTPIVNGTAYPTTTVDPTTYRYRVLNAANDRFWNLSWYVADASGTEVALNPVELAAAQTDPVVSPTPDESVSPKGPDWIQIGTEGGFLPAPVIVPASPTVWINDPTRFDVGNVDHGSLLLAPAERADVIVDFSQYAGQTLILYNDAPAAFPARVPGYDYYTGGPDLTPSGAPTTLPGYGPNTRTVMRVTVNGTVPDPALAFNKPGTSADKMGLLNAAFRHHANGSGVFESGSDPIIVGQAAYNSAYGTNFAAAGWCNSPTNPTAKCDGFARISEQGAVPGQPDTFKFKFDTLAGPQLAIPFEPKGMHDEMNSASFDEWGRMTANLGLEAPGATPLLQNIILYPFVNPATEVLDSTGMPSSLDVKKISSGTDGTQIWKITHNGVDTHPVHFHLYNVQVLNRVTWDNIIIPPDPTELGWKETVRVSPLEDTIVALRPIVPTLPFGLPDSERVLNPAMPLHAKGDINSVLGTEAGFNNTTVAGNPMTVAISNEVTDFGWEYVFHCHILSHEEMDMMRPVTVHATRNFAPPPTLNAARNGGNVELTWTDGTPVDMANPNSWTNPGTAEIGYRVERASGTNGPFSVVPNSARLANELTFTDTVDTTQIWRYRITAFNAAGDSRSNVVTVAPPVVLKATTTSLTSSRNPATYGQSVTFTARVTVVAPATGTPTGTVQFNINGVPAVGGVRNLNASGVATFSSSKIPGGVNSVVAVYSGDAAFSTSTSPTVSQTITKANSTTTLTSSANPSRLANSSTVTLTARVTPTAASPGFVQFTLGGTNVGLPVALDATGRATLIQTLGVGVYSFRAGYIATTNYNASQSAIFTQTVTL